LLAIHLYPKYTKGFFMQEMYGYYQCFCDGKGEHIRGDRYAADNGSALSGVCQPHLLQNLDMIRA
jgi:hypothetical protein